MLSSEVSEFLSNFEPGTHAIYFYDAQDKKRELLFNHLKFGQNRQGLAYVCSEEAPEQIRKEMIDFGIDATSVSGSRRLTIANYDDVYIVNGEVRIPEIIGKFARLAHDCRTLGLTGLRAAAEMSCFLRQNRVGELVEYEKALHRKFAFKAEGICAYNITEMSALGFLGVLMPLVRAHDPIIFASPKGYFILKPEKVENRHIEMMLVN